MSVLREKAEKMRRDGKSYSEISSKLKIGKSTLNGWFAKHEWSKAVTKKLSEQALKKNWERFRSYLESKKIERKIKYENIRLEACESFKKYRADPLFLLGLSIYWGEGDKVTPSIVRVSNVDAEMIKVFSLFLQKYSELPSERLRAGLVIYRDNDETMCKKFWSESIPLPYTQFFKTQVIQGRHKTRRLHNGICSLSVSNRVFKEKLLTWIKQIPKVVAAS